MDYQSIRSELSVRDQVANIIRKRIIDGEYKDGERITERAISEDLNISTTPVKEAFRILETEGILVVKPRKGTFVAEFSAQAIKNTTFIRSSLEGTAAYFAAMYMSEADKDAMFDALAKCAHCLESRNFDSITAYTSAFHDTIRKASNNSYLLTLLSTLRSLDYSIREITVAKSYEEHLRDYFEHRDIANAISSGNSAKAEQLMVNHIRRVIDDTLN